MRRKSWENRLETIKLSRIAICKWMKTSLQGLKMRKLKSINHWHIGKAHRKEWTACDKLNSMWLISSLGSRGHLWSLQQFCQLRTPRPALSSKTCCNVQVEEWAKKEYTLHSVVSLVIRNQWSHHSSQKTSTFGRGSNEMSLFVSKLVLSQKPHLSKVQPTVIGQLQRTCFSRQPSSAP